MEQRHRNEKMVFVNLDDWEGDGDVNRREEGRIVWRRKGEMVNIMCRLSVLTNRQFLLLD